MDYYVHFLGMPHIPEDKRGEYAERMLEIFRAGGLFDTVTVNLTGLPVTLLRVPEPNANGVVKCRFSAFDLVLRNAVRRTAAYRPDSGRPVCQSRFRCSDAHRAVF